MLKFTFHHKRDGIYLSTFLYSITASRLESNDCESESNKQNGDNTSSDKKTKRNFLKFLFK